MVQSTRAPLLFRHRMSDLPSPLKSPKPAIFQDASGAAGLPPNVTVWLEAIWDPFIVQSTRLPLLLRHKTSDLPSPLKSPSPAIFQDASGAAADAPSPTFVLDKICEPFIVQSISVPLVFRHRRSAFPFPLKSPTPETLQDASGATGFPASVTCWFDVICAPLSVQ